MPDVTELIVWEVLIFLFALFGIVVIQILTGTINARGLLEGTTRSSGIAWHQRQFICGQ
jgi:hypothetical protein